MNRQGRHQRKTMTQETSEKFSLLDQERSDVDRGIPPLTKSLVGILRNAQVDEADYRRYLEKKSR